MASPDIQVLLADTVVWLSNYKQGSNMGFYFLLVIMVFFTACSTPELKPVEVTASNKTINFLNDVKPVLDKRCVVCHSCYNAQSNKFLPGIFSGRSCYYPAGKWICLSYD